MSHKYMGSSQYGVLHCNKFVDLNGRLVTVLEEEYTGEVYVSLSELKKSGFELFEAGSLPKPGGYLNELNTLQIEQFNYYMRMKAAKYLSRTLVMIRKDYTENLIKEQKEYYKLGESCNRTVNYNSSGNYSITANVQPSPKSYSNNFEHNTNNKNYNRDHSNQNRQPQQPNYQSTRRSFNAERNVSNPTQQSSDESVVSASYSRPFIKKGAAKLPEVSLNVSNKLQSPRSPPTNSKPKESNFGVCQKPEPISDKLPCKPQNSAPLSPITSSEGKLNNVQEEKVSNYGFGSSLSMASSTPVPSPISKPIEQAKASKRKCTAETISQGGGFEYISTVDDNTIIGYALPLCYMNEFSMLNDIANECPSNVNFVPAVGDLIAVFFDQEDTYVRGIVNKIVNGNYTCGLIDFGTIVTSANIRPLHKKFIEIPEFICCVTGSAEDITEIKKAKAVNVEVTSPGELIFEIDETKKKYKGQAKIWDFNDKKTDIPKPVQVFKVAEAKNHLTSGDIVIIVSQVDGSLILRTRECNKLLKEVNQAIEGHQTEAVKGTPVVNQLVLCPYSNDDSNNLYRAEVLSVDGQFANVRYTDYGDSDKVPISAFKTVNGTLASISNTYIPITLQEFANKKFTNKQLNFLGDCCSRREKFTVISKGGTQGFDLLFADKTSLSEKLIDLEKPPVAVEPVKVPTEVSMPSPKEKIYGLVNLKECELKIGMNEVVCVSNEDAADGMSSFCPNSDEIINRLTEITESVNNHVAVDHTPYKPKLLEMCLAKYDGDWFRGGVVDVYDEDFLIYFVDYGNTSRVKFENLRKISEKLANYQACAANCTFKDLNKDGSMEIKEPLLSKFLNHLKETEEYQINVLRKSDEFYEITIPSVYNKLKEEGVL